MAIIVSINGKNARKLDESPVENEEFLQRYVFDNPASLPVDQIKEGLRLLIVGREVPTASGPIDVLALDQDGDIYVIETKLFQNPDKRRVVAQVLDYGAALWFGADDFVRAMDDLVARESGTGVRQKLVEAFGYTDDEASRALDVVQANLREGNFKFVVLMDQLHDSLKKLLQFLNAKSQFTIFAVEMEFYRHGQMEIVIPRLFGAEARKETGPSSALAKTKKFWDEALYFANAQHLLTGAQISALRALYEYSKSNADWFFWGTGKRGSFNPRFDKLGPHALFNAYFDGRLDVNFRSTKDGPPGESVKKLLREKLNRIGLGPIPEETAYYSIDVNTWYGKVDDFIQVVQGLQTFAEQLNEGRSAVPNE